MYLGLLHIKEKGKSFSPLGSKYFPFFFFLIPSDNE